MKRSNTIALVALAAACTPGLRKPPTGPHPAFGAEPIFVDEAPPPAKIDEVPPAPSNESCVWIDGAWAYTDRGWQWTAGEWILPPASCYFAPPAIGWINADEKGLLWYRPGRWYGPEGSSTGEKSATCAEPTPCGPRRPGVDQ